MSGPEWEQALVTKKDFYNGLALTFMMFHLMNNNQTLNDTSHYFSKLAMGGPEKFLGELEAILAGEYEDE